MKMPDFTDLSNFHALTVPPGFTLIEQVFHEIGENLYPEWDREKVLNHTNEIKPEFPPHMKTHEEMMGRVLSEMYDDINPDDVRLRPEVVAEIAANRRAENLWVEMYREAIDRLLKLCQTKLILYGLDETGKITEIERATWFGVYSIAALQKGACYLDGNFLAKPPSQMDRHSAKASGRLLPKFAFLTAKSSVYGGIVSGLEPTRFSDTRDIEKRVRAFLRREISASPTAPKTKKVIKTLFEAEHGPEYKELSRNKFDGCWDEVVKEIGADAWSNGGRRPKREVK
jgi:hypothetical protein